MELTVLLADDDELVCKCLKSFIPWEELHCKLIGCASDGKMAYEMAQKYLPDIIITDIKMPHMDGTDLCIKIKSERSDVKIVFLSAYENFETAKIAIKYNVQDYILKPIDKQKIAEICEILRLDSEEKRNKAWIDSFLSHDNHSLIKEKIARSDGRYFEELFGYIKSSDMRLENIRLIYNKILQIAYDYFEQMGINPEILKASKDKNRDFLEKCQSVEDIVQKLEKMMENLINTGSATEENFTTELVGKIVELIEKKFFETGFSVSTIANELHYSSDYISRVFKEFMGTSPASYIAQKKMMLSRQLLGETELPIRSVAQKSGFMSDDYFIKAFKKSNGMTPAEFRTYYRRTENNLKNKKEQ